MRLKIVVGLGNPGPEHDATRHNVGWWVVDRLAYDWGFRAFEKKDDSLVSEGNVVGSSVQLLKPLTYMNRSGFSLRHLINLESFRVKEDLLVIVDDAALEVGRVRFRAEGGPGGHNGLKSVSGFLQSDAYARLRIGVGLKPEGQDLADWVLARMSEEDEDIVLDLLPVMTNAVEVWIEEGVEEGMNRFNQ